MLGGFGIVIAALGIAWLLFVPAASWLAHLDVGSATGSHFQAARDAAQGRLLTLGAGLFAAGALIFTARNYTLSREGQVTERYTKAIEQLGSDNLDVRTGGIYALERVARDSARDHPTVMAVLAAFVRKQSHEGWPPVDDQSGADAPLRTIRPDVQAAVAVIGRRDPKNDRQAVNLNSANLPGADLTGAQLNGADLTGADLTGAQLNGANLTGAWLKGADLTGARLNDAQLTGARLNGADLTGAQLNGADLTRARLTRANLTSADLTSARLADVWLPSADFTQADLDSASLIGANLAEVTLTGANLSFADLTGANLTGANLTGANLSRAYLTDAVWPTDATVPGGWQRDSGSGQLAGIASAPANTGELSHYRKYVFPTERILVAERMHPITILAPAVWILAGTFIAGFVTWATPLGNARFVEIIWPVWALPTVWSCWKIANWWWQYFVVTDRRMMLVTGILNRTIRMMPLAKATDMTVHQSRFGHVFGYGDFIIESAGQRQALGSVAFVPHPTQAFREIIALLFAGTARGDGGEQGS